MKTIDWFGRKLTMEWIRIKGKDDVNKYSPILDQKGDSSWTLPGGTVEKGETPRETLEREISEEADVTVVDVQLLGVQKVEDPQNSDMHKHIYYQARYIALVDKVLPQTPDPAKNRIHERRFVPSNEVTQYIKWGVTGDAIFASAIEFYNNNSRHTVAASFLS